MFNEYLLCTDEDLLRSIGNHRIFAAQLPAGYAAREIAKLQAELDRRSRRLAPRS
tara:strand:- start:32 stop:196 length:165 start_codon:yes stop_codon:yes gene_type:complete